jgi:hypothetical protein
MVKNFLLFLGGVVFLIVLEIGVGFFFWQQYGVNLFSSFKNFLSTKSIVSNSPVSDGLFDYGPYTVGSMRVHLTKAVIDGCTNTIAFRALVENNGESGVIVEQGNFWASANGKDLERSDSPYYPVLNSGQYLWRANHIDGWVAFNANGISQNEKELNVIFDPMQSNNGQMIKGQQIKVETVRRACVLDLER